MVSLLGFDSDMVNVKFVVPAIPSFCVTSLMVIVGWESSSVIVSATEEGLPTVASEIVAELIAALIDSPPGSYITSDDMDKVIDPVVLPPEIVISPEPV